MITIYIVILRWMDLCRIVQSLLKIGGIESNISRNRNKILINNYMTSIKLKFRPHTDTNEAGTLYFQIIHRRVVKY